ncbi:MAG: Nucleoid occlusion protein [Deltaproteobacteria bacterium ADurb.BinA014]|nr:MAG: Nucleoid occlusion protein [Deltaproteobacteria bacterium ADurb.BinA014]
MGKARSEMTTPLFSKKIEFPVLNVKMVPLNKLHSNDYNPNHVAPPEMRLLKLSIEEDGFTQPIVCYYDKENDIYVIVDGFHRYRCALEYFNLPEVPVVVIDKPLENRMASTIRHNRARGKHVIDPMVELVNKLHEHGWEDYRIAKELGMDADEVLRLLQQTGLPGIYANKEFSYSWIPESDEEETE